MAGWLVMLFTTLGIAASDFFCINLSTIANILGMSESMAGVTFLAFGNGSPDVFSTFAAMKINSGSLAVGELIGAASFIAAVVAGSMAIVRPFRVGRRSFVRDVCFFIVAVLFGIFFLADGKIQMWECIVMVMFYCFYVCFVVAWHWASQSRKRRRRKERSAREHFVVPEEEETIDDDDEDGGVGETTGLLDSTHDFRALERGESEDNDEEEQEQQAYAELSNSMRLTRPPMERHTTPATPHGIRPSLVGALEFRAVLSSLEKNKNLQGRPIHLRRYSDGPFLSLNTSSYSAPGSLVIPGNFGDRQSSEDDPVADPNVGRSRGLSLNDSAGANVDHEYFGRSTNDSPRVNITQPTPLSSQLVLATDGASFTRAKTPDFLAPPSPTGYPRGSRYSPTHSEPASPMSQASSGAPQVDLASDSGSQRFTESPRPFGSPSASPPPSIRLPPPSIDPASLSPLPAGNWKVLKYWPYHILSPPQILFGTLFPTLRGFKGKSWMEKCLGLIALPSVFLLTITLPVVEGGSQTSDKTPTVVLEPESPASTITGGDLMSTNGASSGPGHGVSASDGVGPKEWNRWLVAIQCITAPVFMVVMFLADDEIRLLKPILYALLGGLIALAFLLILTTPERAPRWRYLLCFAGFAVAIGWISAIANEVVGVLKAFGVIFGISDAILGLTIFAIGNSLGDLVADITVARLGFPVMALSACFGGPMLNILLGIGISGLYMTTISHSHKDADYYPIEVSSTLIISAATLLITLVLLLIAVPLNRWMMTRKIGFALIGLWVVSTVVNIVVELTGLGSKWGGKIAV
ncbi:unnamed protein product [Tuber melanosporum]|uniref:(Perigord truffle) hypothetical protein n=1 Tax=Tuber melanosporum (strain Mel28) TaxID=656061 RepID=D5GHC5_TUBMM|nr:uncharacterized protein GSTUM_00007753001 [Tuber melanosporum]CAZ83877.1 unnamed protein product [Tuber melanosporum]